MAVTVGAGEVGISVLEELSKYNAVTVTGGNIDVGIAGWFTGGGRSKRP
jgi:TRAP-type mannitol/chloroaromatic compound transport system substrate-binding protein